MFHDELFLTGATLAFTTIMWTFFFIGLQRLGFFHGMLLLTSIVLVVILLEYFSSLSSSSAAPPACLDGFIVETNGGTGGAYTCTPLSLDPLSGGGEGVYFPTP